MSATVVYNPYEAEIGTSCYGIGFNDLNFYALIARAVSKSYNTAYDTDTGVINNHVFGTQPFPTAESYYDDGPSWQAQQVYFMVYNWLAIRGMFTYPIERGGDYWYWGIPGAGIDPPSTLFLTPKFKEMLSYTDAVAYLFDPDGPAPEGLKYREQWGPFMEELRRMLSLMKFIFKADAVLDLATGDFNETRYTRGDEDTEFYCSDYTYPVQLIARSARPDGTYKMVKVPRLVGSSEVLEPRFNFTHRRYYFGIPESEYTPYITPTGKKFAINPGTMMDGWPLQQNFSPMHGFGSGNGSIGVVSATGQIYTAVFPGWPIAVGPTIRNCLDQLTFLSPSAIKNKIIAVGASSTFGASILDSDSVDVWGIGGQWSEDPTYTIIHKIQGFDGATNLQAFKNTSGTGFRYRPKDGLVFGLNETATAKSEARHTVSRSWVTHRAYKNAYGDVGYYSPRPNGLIFIDNNDLVARYKIVPFDDELTYQISITIHTQSLGYADDSPDVSWTFGEESGSGNATFVFEHDNNDGDTFECPELSITTTLFEADEWQPVPFQYTGDTFRKMDEFQNTDGKYGVGNVLKYTGDIITGGLPEAFSDYMTESYSGGGYEYNHDDPEEFIRGVPDIQNIIGTWGKTTWNLQAVPNVTERTITAYLTASVEIV